MKHFAIALLLTTLVACASHKNYTQEQWMTMTTHDYPGKTVSEVLDATDKVLRLADPPDMKIYHWPDRISAIRSYSVYMVFSFVIGTFNFDVRADQTQTVSRVTALITNSASGNKIIDDPETYNLLFSRINHFLNSEQWYTCQQASMKYSESNSRSLDALCLMADDKLPDKPKSADSR
jgi:hypothetical protein